MFEKKKVEKREEKAEKMEEEKQKVALTSVVQLLDRYHHLKKNILL